MEAKHRSEGEPSVEESSASNSCGSIDVDEITMEKAAEQIELKRLSKEGMKSSFRVSAPLSTVAENHDDKDNGKELIGTIGDVKSMFGPTVKPANCELETIGDGVSLAPAETVAELTDRIVSDVQPTPVPATALARGNHLPTSRPGAHAVLGPFASRYRTDFFETATAEQCFEGHIDEESPARTDEIHPSLDLYEGQVMPHPMQQRGSKMGWLAIVAAAIIGLVGVLFLVLPTDSSLPNEEEAVMASQVTIHPSGSNSPFSDDLPEMVVSSIKHESDSPFYHANLWLLNDPSLESYSNARKKQRFFLAMLYYATSGENWINNEHWLSYNISECRWFSRSSYTPNSPYYEPSICDSNETMINLSLADNNLDGLLPIWYTSFLPFLRVLDIANNNIGGQLPVITTSECLEVLILSNTGLYGTPIINMMGYYINLKIFEWFNAKIEGEQYEAFLPMIPNVEVYNATGFPFQGTITSALSALTNLQNLGLGDNQAHGTIPSELGILTDLVHLDLSRLPFLSGLLPSEFGHLTKLTQLDLFETPVRGQVPATLCDLVAGGLLKIEANCSLLECCW